MHKKPELNFTFSKIFRERKTCQSFAASSCIDEMASMNCLQLSVFCRTAGFFL
jgi:hypothetical protein